jgi:hypothetical protein
MERVAKRDEGPDQERELLDRRGLCGSPHVADRQRPTTKRPERSLFRAWRLSRRERLPVRAQGLLRLRRLTRGQSPAAAAEPRGDWRRSHAARWLRLAGGAASKGARRLRTGGSVQRRPADADIERTTQSVSRLDVRDGAPAPSGWSIERSSSAARSGCRVIVPSGSMRSATSASSTWVMICGYRPRRLPRPRDRATIGELRNATFPPNRLAAAHATERTLGASTAGRVKSLRSPQSVSQTCLSGRGRKPIAKRIT